MIRLKIRLSTLLLLAWALTSRPVSAQDASSRALAVQLFDEAEALFSKGSVAEACPKYAESYRLDPQLGALLYLAECYEKNGQLASAWGSYREADELARQRGDARGEQARKKALELEPRLSFLVVRIATKARVPELQILKDGVSMAPVLWGARAAIDPGSHRIEARAPGYKSWSTEVVVADERSTSEVEVPALERLPRATAGGADRPAQSGGGQRIAALAVGGLGIVGLGVGGFFGLSAQASQSDSKELCNEKNYCTPDGDKSRRDAQSKALLATISSGVGAAALVAAGVLWFTAPKSEAKAGTRQRATRTSLVAARQHFGLELHHAFE